MAPRLRDGVLAPSSRRPRRPIPAMAKVRQPVRTRPWPAGAVGGRGTRPGRAPAPGPRRRHPLPRPRRTPRPHRGRRTTTATAQSVHRKVAPPAPAGPWLTPEPAPSHQNSAGPTSSRRLSPSPAGPLASLPVGAGQALTRAGQAPVKAGHVSRWQVGMPQRRSVEGLDLDDIDIDGAGVGLGQLPALQVRRARIALATGAAGVDAGAGAGCDRAPATHAGQPTAARTGGAS